MSDPGTGTRCGVKKPSGDAALHLSPPSWDPDPVEQTGHLLGVLIAFLAAEFKGHNRVDTVCNIDWRGLLCSNL